MTRVSWDEYFLGIAEEVSGRSTCSRLHVGAVLVRDNHAVGFGYNGAPRGMSHCVHVDDSPCRISVHAEVNALLHCSSVLGVAPVQMYVTHAPCFDCAKLMINCKITRVTYSTLYRSDEGLRLLSDAGIMVEWVK